MLLTQSDVFALSNEELGETELVSHRIDAGDAKPITTTVCIMSRVGRRDEEADRHWMIDTSNSSYASPLVLVRKTRKATSVCGLPECE